MSLFHFYYDPATEFDRLFEDAFAARFSPRNATPQHRDTYRPRLDLYESEDTNTVTVTFELPGLTSEGIAIDVRQDRLTVSGELNSSASHEEGSYVVRERRSGKFTRTLQLPLGTKPEDVNARMENGILTITFPMTSPEQQAARIAVQ